MRVRRAISARAPAITCYHEVMWRVETVALGVKEETP
jgi:hypothetical protein